VECEIQIISSGTLTEEEKVNEYIADLYDILPEPKLSILQKSEPLFN
jgi:hypothetical protein